MKNGVIIVEKWNIGSEYIPPPLLQLNWLHALMKISVVHGRKESMARKFSKIFKLAYKELYD